MNRAQTRESAGRTTDKIERANSLFQEFYTSCFWHMKPDLVVTKAMIPVIVKGLRTYGGRRGMLAAAELTEGARGCPRHSLRFNGKSSCYWRPTATRKVTLEAGRSSTARDRARATPPTSISFTTWPRVPRLS
jgi:hypothetical protein